MRLPLKEQRNAAFTEAAAAAAAITKVNTAKVNELGVYPQRCIADRYVTVPYTVDRAMVLAYRRMRMAQPLVRARANHYGGERYRSFACLPYIHFIYT